MAQQLPAAYVFDPKDPRSPSDEQWAAMTPEERARAEDMLEEAALRFYHATAPPLDAEEGIARIEFAVNDAAARAAEAAEARRIAEDRVGELELQVRELQAELLRLKGGDSGGGG